MDEASNRFRLVAVLGTGDYKPVRYRLGDSVSDPCHYASVAAVQLLSSQSCACAEVHLLVTSEAEALHASAFESELGARDPGVECQFVSIPTAGSEDGIMDLFARIAALPSDLPIVVDITHGYRSIPVILLSALRFLGAVSDSMGELRILYGAYEAQDDGGVAPLLDLSALGNLDRWAAATRDFKRHLDTRALEDIMRSSRRTARVQSNEITAIGELSDCLRSGLPLEAGLAASRLAHSGLVDRIRAMAPAAEQLASTLSETLEDIKADAARQRDKTTIVLNNNELAREARLIDSAFDEPDVGKAVRLAREWLVNRVLLQTGNHGKWLDRGYRDRAMKALNLSCKYQGKSEWRSVSRLVNRRNELAHCGIAESPIRPNALAAELKQCWHEIVAMPDDAFALVLAQDEHPSR